MNADELLRHYERIADVPDSVGRLRGFVLELAVRGKLVPQDSAEEPSIDLIHRLTEAKARLLSIGDIPKDRQVPELAGSPPFAVPDSWQWVPFGELHQLVRGVTYSKSDVSEVPADGFVPVLRANNIDVRLTHDEPVYVKKERVSPEQFLRSGDFMIALSSGSKNLVGKAAIVPETCPEAFGGFCGVIRLYDHSVLHFVWVYLRSNLYRESIAAGSRGIGINNLKKETITSLHFPLPPLAEQHRIVAKVDELMALCDRLEAARAEREAARDRLTAASLVRFNTPDPETFREDAHFVLSALASLTSRPDQVRMLRRAILNLACMGKLVPQDPGDEPASVLLDRIAAGKATRKSTTGDARIKDAPAPEASALAMQLPTGWEVQSFENLFLFIDYRGNTPTKTDDGVPLITAKNVRMGRLNREPREFISAETYKTWMTRGFPKVGDLFFTTEAPLANVCLNDINEPFALAQRVICLQPYGEINTRFLMFVLMSDLLQSLIDAHATGLTAKGIKASKLKPLPIPLPPLAEQHRIVAKVDELVALCDRLESALAGTGEHQRRLMEAALREALNRDELEKEAA